MQRQFLKCLLFLVVALFLLAKNLSAQTDSVDVTFYYKSTGTPSVVFLPGEFNSWGPNSNGVIAQNAPSRMTYDPVNGRWFKTVRLRIGGPASGGRVTGAYQYKFNENGSSSGWLSDPLNPRRNAADNDNSILYTKNPTIHYLLPNTLSGLVNAAALRISSYLFSSTKEAIDPASIRVVINTTEYTNLGSAYDPATKFFSFTPTLPLLNGTNTVRLFARTTAGSQSVDSSKFNYAANPPLVVEPLPAGVRAGINYMTPTTATLALFAPRKNFVYVLGDFNNWQIDSTHFMKRTPDSSHYWITLNGLQPQKEYIFQYFVDGKLKIADPYADKISDPQHDKSIAGSTYPNLIQYPAGKTEEIASVLQTSQAPYSWQVSNFPRPAQKDLVIYELLIRDFTAAHDYKTLLDTLSYLHNLGINAIELMPIMEFEGNESWGYNPAFYFAPDKYYGPQNDLKRFIDACHQRGIAVILDLVLQHSYGQHPLLRLYSQGPYGPPAPDNPWYNVSAPHTDFSFGHDFNHESSATKLFVDRVNSYWLTEYRVDGFRFDFTRGFTNRFGASGGRDNARIAILKRMADQIWAVDSTAYVILEHLIDDNGEMKELAEYKRGMLLWGNMNFNYNEATMGYHENGKSDFSWGAYTTRGWAKPHLITYMESHDEERLMSKNIRFGNRSSNYNVKDTTTALERIKLASAFFFTIPGPKMIWQFGELGYDYSIDYNGRVGNKPIRWDYGRETRRKNLNKVFAALIKLRTKHDAFGSSNFSLSLRDAVKRISIIHNTMNVVVIGNFDVASRSANPSFVNTGKWYDFFSGDSLAVTDTQMPIPLQPGEFHIYTTKKLPTPERGIVTAVQEKSLSPIASFVLHQNYPNPFLSGATSPAQGGGNLETTIRFELPRSSEVKLRVFNLLGAEVLTLLNERMPAGTYSFKWDGKNAAQQQVVSGVYLLRLEAGNEVGGRKMVLVR